MSTDTSFVSLMLAAITELINFIFIQNHSNLKQNSPTLVIVGTAISISSRKLIQMFIKVIK